MSTEDQANGPDAQRSAVERWAALGGASVVAWYSDLGVSGATDPDARPGLLGALAALEQTGAGVLVVAKRDRLARSLYAAAMIERLVERAGARIETADGVGNGDGPEAEMLRGIVDVFARYERALIAARTRAALKVKRARGERVGGVPYGWRDDGGGQLVPDPEEQRALAYLGQLRAEGYSVRAIAAKMQDAGFPARGRKWHRSTVGELVKGRGHERGTSAGVLRVQPAGRHDAARGSHPSLHNVLGSKARGAAGGG